MPDEVLGALTALLFLAAALLTAWLCARVLEIRQTGVVIALMLLPAVIYLVVAGRIGELRAPGGFEARFLSVAAQPVRFAERRVEASVQPVQLTTRGSAAELPKKLAALDPLEPTILTVKLGQTYDRLDWLRYVEALLGQPGFEMAALLDGEDRFVAYLTVKAVRDVLGNAALGGELIRLIAEGSAEEILLFPSAGTEVLSPDSSAMDALRTLRRNEVDSLPVIDRERRILGVVNTQDVLSQIVLDLAAVSPAPAP